MIPIETVSTVLNAYPNAVQNFAASKLISTCPRWTCIMIQTVEIFQSKMPRNNSNYHMENHVTNQTLIFQSQLLQPLPYNCFCSLFIISERFSFQQLIETILSQVGSPVSIKQALGLYPVLQKSIRCRSAFFPCHGSKKHVHHPQGFQQFFLVINLFFYKSLK